MKRFIVLIICVLLIGCSSTEPVELNGEVGDYILYGHYLDEPILWQIVEVNEGEYVLWSDKILAFKSFDAAGSQNVFYTNEDVLLYDLEDDFFNDTYYEVSDEARVEAFGSGRWLNSSLRAWLNSSDDVNYERVPIKEAVFPNGFSYDNEIGFLHGFTDKEQSNIVENTHKALCYNSSISSLGSELHEYVWNKTPKDSVLNYEDAYYEMVTDKVFLLSVAELGMYSENADINYFKIPVNDIAFETERRYLDYYEYWLRTPYPDRPSSVRTSHPSGTVSSWIASSDEIGVVPAIRINGMNFISVQGEGTKENPYTVE